MFNKCIFRHMLSRCIPRHVFNKCLTNWLKFFAYFLQFSWFFPGNFPQKFGFIKCLVGVFFVKVWNLTIICYCCCYHLQALKMRTMTMVTQMLAVSWIVIFVSVSNIFIYLFYCAICLPSYWVLCHQEDIRPKVNFLLINLYDSCSWPVSWAEEMDPFADFVFNLKCSLMR